MHVCSTHHVAILRASGGRDWSRELLTWTPTYRPKLICVEAESSIREFLYLDRGIIALCWRDREMNTWLFPARPSLVCMGCISMHWNNPFSCWTWSELNPGATRCLYEYIFQSDDFRGIRQVASSRRNLCLSDHFLEALMRCKAGLQSQSSHSSSWTLRIFSPPGSEEEHNTVGEDERRSKPLPQSGLLLNHSLDSVIQPRIKAPTCRGKDQHRPQFKRLRFSGLQLAGITKGGICQKLSWYFNPQSLLVFYQMMEMAFDHLWPPYLLLDWCSILITKKV